MMPSPSLALLCISPIRSFLLILFLFRLLLLVPPRTYSHTNPYYYGETNLTPGHLGGIGSEDASGNAGLGHVWPLSLSIRLLTLQWSNSSSPTPADDAADAEALATLAALVESSGGTGLMHESFWYTDPTTYTRFWFAMANSFLGEAVMYVAEHRPGLLFKDA